MDNRYIKLAKNSGIMLAGNISSKVISFLLLPVYTKFLSTAAYGESDMISVYASILLAVITCCVADGMFVFPKKENEEGKAKYFTSGLLFVIGTFSLLALLLFALDLIFDRESTSGGILLLDKWWIYLLSFSMFTQQYCQQFTLSLEKTVCYSLTGVVMTILLAVLAIILLPIYGLPGYLWSLIIANFGAALFSFITSKSYLFFSFKSLDYQYIKNLLGYGVPLIPNSIMWWLVNGLNRPLMEHYLGLSAIGIFAVASRFPSVLTVIFQVIGQGMSISVIDEFNKKDFNEFYNRILKILTVSVLFVGVVLSLGSKIIIRVFAAAEYFEAWKYMPMLTLAVIFQCMGGFVGNVFMAEKKSKFFFYSSFWASLASILLTILLINVWGITGVCIAVIGSFLTLFVMRVYYAWKHINLFSIKYYTLSFILYLSVVVLITLECNIFIIIAAVSIFLMAMFLMNKKDIMALVYSLKSHLKKQ